MGFYHFWVVHSARYSHEKYPFVFTSNIEGTWARFKRESSGIKWLSKPHKIERYADSFSMRQILKQHVLYPFTLRCMREYYFDQLQIFKQHAKYEELYFSSIEKIDNINDILRSEGSQRISKLMTSERWVDESFSLYKNFGVEDIQEPGIPDS